MVARPVRALMFQSTPPSREATRMSIRRACMYKVSIHAPLTGGDEPFARLDGAQTEVSIHAPLTGGDKSPHAKERRL